MNLKLFTVSPLIPEALQFLETLGNNMWWCWNHDAIDLFRRIDPHLWKELGHCPCRFLSSIPQAKLEALAADESYLQHLRQVQTRFNAHMASAHEPLTRGKPCPRIAYFSLEYGIHESIRIYSGGLGGLAGDHLKSASEMDLPMVAVGLMYRLGYFRQFVDSDGWQVENFPENEVQHMPLLKVQAADGQQLTVTLPMPEGTLKAAVWRLQVGKIPLYLLDTNLPDNSPEFRAVTEQLYGGDRKTRLRQELLLGIGGFRALIAVGYEPTVCHINEGHAAFLSIARLEHIMKTQNIDLDTALEVVPRTSVFTTHTPVPAGNEYFDLGLLRPHLDTLAGQTGIPADRIVALGKTPDSGNSNELSMTVLGLRLANYANGVSKLHGEVARRMWAGLWPNRPQDEIPIGHVTNGVHVPSWLSPDHSQLYDRYLGPDWRNHPGSANVKERINGIPDEELWRAHETCRSRLVRTVREIMEKHFVARNAPAQEIAQLKSILDHDTLTIGFARRFATYKRATLLLRYPDRFEALLRNEERPVQFIFAGKAHPADNEGKRLIQEIVRFARRVGVRRRVVFVENYNIYLARAMVQGVDVWLNTPRRPQEASGTSGMKVAVNGGINASVLDGWWCEGITPDSGWAIGHGAEYHDTEFGDAADSQFLYNLLENEIIPLFYDRGTSEIPAKWIHKMRASITMSLDLFSSHRMLAEYDTRFYRHAASAYQRLLADKASYARELVAQHRRLEQLWPAVHVAPPITEARADLLHVGDKLSITTHVSLGALTPDEVEVEVYYGPVDAQNRIMASHSASMTLAADTGNGSYTFKTTVLCDGTGRYGFTARVTPRGNTWRAATPGFITWADGV